MQRLVTLLLILPLLLWTGARLDAQSRIPDRLSDDAFWKLIQDISEPAGVFVSDNFVSNEVNIQAVVPQLQSTMKPDGVFIGVGAEQNFTLMLGVRPKLSFIIDIRRENMHEHLMYKALFELAPNRADFLARLFSRKRPDGLNATSTAAELMAAFAVTMPEPEILKRNVEDIRGQLLTRHGLPLSTSDQDSIEAIYRAFGEFGPAINYNSGRLSSGRVATAGIPAMPSFVDVIKGIPPPERNLTFLGSEESYNAIRDLQLSNRIIPVVGDFGGPKAIQAIGQYLKDHGGTVTAFYVSNVESYLLSTSVRGAPNGGFKNFCDNVATLPLDQESKFIRIVGGSVAPRPAPGGLQGFALPPVIAPIQETLEGFRSGRIKTYPDLFPAAK